MAVIATTVVVIIISISLLLLLLLPCCLVAIVAIGIVGVAVILVVLGTALGHWLTAPLLSVVVVIVGVVALPPGSSQLLPSHVMAIVVGRVVVILKLGQLDGGGGRQLRTTCMQLEVGLVESPPPLLLLLPIANINDGIMVMKLGLSGSL
ncbi:hypothetical protein EDB85DRAFT_1887625 [Lactarius pseudohatsudake]|nr:hypothetical protein EDB85DRAFT_1887625 [Lactarius pseudohatsudake]